MKYNIKINEVKGDDSQIQAFATVTFADSILVRNIAIIKRRDSDELFVSMPSYRTNEVTEKGEPVYREIAFPVTKEFREQLFGAFEQEYAVSKDSQSKSKEKDTAPRRSVKH